MGCASSKADYIPNATGDEAEYKSRFVEESVLGAGEFGTVKLVKDTNAGASAEPLAVKLLNKGITFKNNEVFPPMKPETLQAEISILRSLEGKKYNLRLDSVYESSSVVYVVTEICTGGEMLEYLSKSMPSGLRSEDASRMAFQLLSAVDHCARNGVIHRDIKPENIMFKQASPGSELRLIDFGCATQDETEAPVQHVTFAGTPFYISPEMMYHHKYTSKTDVWSVAVTLYVLVAGYPAEQLQKAFNILLKSKRDLKTLPNLPDNMPESYYEMLEEMLMYKQSGRKSAGEMLDCEFVQFHKEHEEEKAAKPSARPKVRRTSSVLFAGAVERHGTYMGFKKFERAVTTLIATTLSKGDLEKLLHALKDGGEAVSSLVAVGEEKKDDEGIEVSTTQKDLGVIKISELKQLLCDLGFTEVSSMIDKQKNASMYGSFAYHIKPLKQFAGNVRNTTKAAQPQSNDETDDSVTKVPTRRRRSSLTQPRTTESLQNMPELPTFNTDTKKRALGKAQSVYIRGT